MPDRADFSHNSNRDRPSQPPKRGKVYLIGAGPGDIELLTLKAVRCIGESDVLLLDSLANPDVLQFAKKDVRVIHVGKRFGLQSTSQEQIHALMLEFTTKGLVVARIKGGDPVVFARGGEELQTLLDEQIEVEIVNGITSGIAVPSALGIPLTHRDYSHEVVFSLGPSFSCPQNLLLPDVGDFKFTLVIYMGLNNISEIAAELLHRGAPPETPAAAIQSGTLPEQRFVMAPLQSLAAKVANAGLRSPVLIIVGKVISLSPHYRKIHHQEEIVIRQALSQEHVK